MLIVLSPLLLLVAAVVLMRSGWPIFYGSERIGLAGRRFQMWKFRTMVRDADAMFERWKETHPDRAAHLLTHWKLEADPRVTALGRFLRKSSLDELPQFWNVLCGEMSIAGPRPYLSRESLDPDLVRAIISVRPGLTGPFQVRGRKGLSPQARMQLEAGYAAEVRLMKDIGYMLRTLRPLMELDGH
jgi:exopolysaccharide production protein ExoY